MTLFQFYDWMKNIILPRQKISTVSQTIFLSETKFGKMNENFVELTDIFV